jgi:methionine biosynthesis protein MetW
VSTQPDASALGILGRQPDPLRYGGGDASAATEVPGIIRALTPDHVRVLDVGCGTGGQTCAINQGKNNDVVAVEPDPVRAAAAASLGLNVHQGVFNEQFVASCGTFDVIVFADVLEHVADPAHILALARGCLRPGGSVIISVPNVAHWTVRLRLLLGRFDYADGGIMDATHLRWFTRKTVLALAGNTGFKVTYIGYSAGLWMSEYNTRPLNLIPSRILRRAVLLLLRAFPGLMACQYVVQVQVLERR